MDSTAWKRALGTGKKVGSVKEYRKACIDLALAEAPRVVVEVGVYSGKLSRYLAELPTLERLYLVDSWEGGSKERPPPFFYSYDQPHMDMIAHKVKDWAAANSKITVVHMRSIDAASLFKDGEVDFFHTDGDHTLEGITSDIRSWLPRVRLGGILSGDNYEMPSVAAGVDELLPHRQLAARGRLWWVRK